jgi:hypothetical protein
VEKEGTEGFNLIINEDGASSALLNAELILVKG